MKPEGRKYERAEHCISRAAISSAALKVLYRLNKGGFRACLVGGGVRDLLLGREPKDFDIATDAEPEQVRELFRNCRLIGRRFRLAHVRFGPEVIEVATFRALHVEKDEDRVIEDGRIVRDNVYGSIEDDAFRRDFTVNALYYDIKDFSVVDFTGGMQDVMSGQLRLIGDPLRRYREDPVRLLRAVRFAVKLGFTIEAATEAPIRSEAYLLESISPARLFEEFLKLFHGGTALQTFEALRHYGLFEVLFPQAEAALAEQEGGFPHMLIARALENTDERISVGKPVTPAFLVAALLWYPMRAIADQLIEEGVQETEALQLASDRVFAQQITRVAIPRRFTMVAREIWMMQSRLVKRTRKRVMRVLGNERFRAGYDFLLLRAETGEDCAADAQWWTEFQDADEAGQLRMLDGLKSGRRKSRRRRRSSGGESPSSDEPPSGGD
ncbi:MAG: polynucleotide adenylyltransferase PcnB [Gammaproteobacteria bacterium]|nr:polynucleotide adenylyltransferase PcnB [Gammaproteobacteria bacterium]NNM01449.1 polynucleotide adenylyltransferase PcnB [Gammaproteobacteria bacterium]